MIFGKFNPAATILLCTNWATMFAPPPLLHAHWGTANRTRKWKRRRRIKQQTLVHRWEFWRQANLPLKSTVKGQEVIKERTGQWWCQETPLRHELKHKRQCPGAGCSEMAVTDFRDFQDLTEYGVMSPHLEVGFDFRVGPALREGWIRWNPCKPKSCCDSGI